MLASRHEKRLPFDVKKAYASLFSLKASLEYFLRHPEDIPACQELQYDRGVQVSTKP